MTGTHLSYSKLKLFSTSFKDYVKRYIIGDKPTLSDDMLFGTFVDQILFDGDIDKDKYVIADVPQLSGHAKVLAEHFVNEKIDDLSDDDLINTATKLGLWKTIKKRDAYDIKATDDKIKEFIKLKSTSKRVVSSNVYHKALHKVTVLKEHKYTTDIINDPTLISRLKLKLPYKETEFIGEIDFITIDETSKIIYPYDLKTGFEYEHNFENSFLKYKYYMQLAIYIGMLEHQYPEYIIAPFRFVYMSTNSDIPVVYQISSELTEASLKGGIYTTRRGYEYNIPDYTEIADELLWHYKYDSWETTREIYDNNGLIIL